VLEELVENAAPQSLRRSLAWWIFATVVPLAAIAVGVWLVFHGREAWGGALCALAIAIGVAKHRGSRPIAQPHEQGTLRIAVSKGTITCRIGDRLLAEAPLMAWSWRPLDPSELDDSPRGPLVLSHDGQHFAVGYDADARSRWEGFLTLAGNGDQGPGTGDPECE